MQSFITSIAVRWWRCNTASFSFLSEISRQLLCQLLCQLLLSWFAKAVFHLRRCQSWTNRVWLGNQTAFFILESKHLLLYWRYRCRCSLFIVEFWLVEFTYDTKIVPSNHVQAQWYFFNFFIGAIHSLVSIIHDEVLNLVVTHKLSNNDSPICCQDANNLWWAEDNDARWEEQHCEDNHCLGQGGNKQKSYVCLLSCHSFIVEAIVDQWWATVIESQAFSHSKQLWRDVLRLHPSSR